MIFCRNTKVVSKLETLVVRKSDLAHQAIELNDLSQMEGTVVYWMSRDQRVDG